MTEMQHRWKLAGASGAAACTFLAVKFVSFSNGECQTLKD